MIRPDLIVWRNFGPDTLPAFSSNGPFKGLATDHDCFSVDDAMTSNLLSIGSGLALECMECVSETKWKTTVHGAYSEPCGMG